MQRGMDLPADLRGDAGNALQLLGRRLEQPLRRAEVLDQRSLASRADAGQCVEDRFAGLRIAAAAVEAEGEAVRLVADPLQELEAGRVALEDDRLGRPGTKTSSSRFASAITATRGRS